MHADIISQISVAIVVATALAFLAKRLRQPLILAYIAAGVLVGSTEGFGWVNTHDIEPTSELGLILLLFMIGLEIDLRKLRRAGTVVLTAGVVQFVVCVGVGLLVLSRFSGGGQFDTVYLAVSCGLSSTMIVVKLLYDKFELDTIPGRVTLGILVLQDLWAIMFLSMQHTLNQPALLPVALSVVKGAGLVAAALLLSRYVMPKVFASVARLPEAVLMTALAWCFGMSALASWLDLSRAMGALVAGITLSAFPYTLDVVAKIISLRDFFITLFFVALGTKIPRPTPALLLEAGLLSVFVVLSRLVSISPVLHRMRQGNRVSLLPALNLAQISEFSLVICTIGLGLGHISERIFSLVVFTLVLTSVASTYLIIHNHGIFTRLSPLLERAGLRDLGSGDEVRAAAVKPDIVFLGFARYASSVLHDLLEQAPELAARIGVVDFNPLVKHELDRRGISNVYGDISHADSLRHANVSDASILLCTLPDSIVRGTTNATLLRQLTRMAPHAQIIVTADFFDTARDLYEQGAAFVFLPRLTSTRELADVVLHAVSGDLNALRRAAVEELSERREVLP